MKKVTGSTRRRQCPSCGDQDARTLEQTVRCLVVRWGYLLRKDRPGRYSIVNPERNHARVDSGLTLAQAAEWINRIEARYGAEREVAR